MDCAGENGESVMISERTREEFIAMTLWENHQLKKDLNELQIRNKALEAMIGDSEFAEIIAKTLKSIVEGKK